MHNKFGSSRKFLKRGFIAGAVALGGLFSYSVLHADTSLTSFLSSGKDPKKNVKLYWLTADGLRADKDLFNMYKWAQEGKLPNIKKLMDRGTRGYSIPNFPSLTSNNIATLHTGATSKVHGIVEGAIREEGNPLGQPNINGFNSASKNVAPTWSILEAAGKKTVVMSVPGSTPPEITDGITIRGRWGNWGFDTPAITFEPESNFKMRRDTIPDFYFASLDKKLTRFVPVSNASGREIASSYSTPIQTALEAHGGSLKAFIYDSTDDKKANYDKVQITDKEGNLITQLAEGSWSKWFPVSLSYNGKDVASHAKVRVIKLWPDGRFRIRVLYNTLNSYMTQPSTVAQELTQNVGPMVDFLDNCLCLGMAPQLIFEPEDKQVALEEARMSWEWHSRAASYVMDKWKPDAFIQDFYTPNQMLVSRWWMGDVDPNRKGYDPVKAKKSWDDLLEMYKGVDKIIGKAMEKADDNTLFVLSSEHGTAPLYKNTRLNNLFAKKGWLKFSMDKKTSKVTIDWKNSKVVYLKMAHVYINPNGLDGNYKKASGPEYEKLRREVIAELKALKDSNGIYPVSKIVKREDAEKVFSMPANRIGDLVLESTTGYRLWEEMTEDRTVFTTPLATGYKEGVNPNDPTIQTPFIIAGPGVKQGHVLSKPISHIDQLPTILKLMKVKIPDYVEGRVIEEVNAKQRSIAKTH